ncbi:hypothetical protein Cantr_04805 [Candida viswanathii]|uniref:Uncharacterized protein n=1 Tax=Candida viswanathii TaxID=5486 RepID=A0A367XLN9_9ASCO|nr:hypothetical protein Cantr_04805 [Candida viswanathii]
MIANSTQISNRMFRSQKIIILTMLAGFLVLLGITGFSGHHNMLEDAVKTATAPLATIAARPETYLTAQASSQKVEQEKAEDKQDGAQVLG